nr:hypothetical protein [Haliscomenobacter sp.]
MSDYQEVNGLFFPFALGQGVKGAGSQPIVITKIELNPQVDPKGVCVYRREVNDR